MTERSAARGRRRQPPDEPNKNISFVGSGRSARPGPTKLNILLGSGGPGFARVGAALRLGFPSLGWAAVVRGPPSFGGAAPPRAALRCALALGPLGSGGRFVRLRALGSPPGPPGLPPIRGAMAAAPQM